MDVKKALVSFLTIATILFLAVSASAYTATGNLADIYAVEIEETSLSNGVVNAPVSVIAGETITVKVFFQALQDASDVRAKIEIEGEREDVSARTELFDVEAGSRYSQTLTLRVPYELKDQVSDNLTLNVQIWNDDFRSEIRDITLRVQRPSYNADVLSVETDGRVQAGDIFPVDIVLKNIGYNDLEDVFVTATIEELDVERTSYFGDLVSVETTDDDVDTVSGRLYLRVPYGAQQGVYTLKVEVSSDGDAIASETRQVEIGNNFPQPVTKTNGGLLFVNPTNELQVYRVVLPSGENIVTVPAGSSKTVEVSATSDNYLVSVLTMSGDVVGNFTFSQSEQDNGFGTPVVVFTVILGIIFLVLLVVLIVLITRKPQKSEEFGESYY